MYKCVCVFVRACVRACYIWTWGRRKTILLTFTTGWRIYSTTAYTKSVTLCGQWPLYYRPCPVSHTVWPIASVLPPMPSQSHHVADGLCTTVHDQSVTLCGLLFLYYRPCPVSHTMWPMACVLPSVKLCGLRPAYYSPCPITPCSLVVLPMPSHGVIS